MIPLQPRCAPNFGTNYSVTERSAVVSTAPSASPAQTPFVLTHGCQQRDMKYSETPNTVSGRSHSHFQLNVYKGARRTLAR